MDFFTFRLVERFLSGVPKYGAVLRVPRVQVLSMETGGPFKPHATLYAVVDVFVDGLLDEFVDILTHGWENIWRQPEGFLLIHG